MDAIRRVLCLSSPVSPCRLAFPLLLIAVSGCALMDPSVFQGYGTAAPPRAEVPRIATPPPPPQGGPSAPAPFGATPGGDASAAVPSAGDLLGRSPENVGIVVEKLDAKTVAEMNLGGSFRARSGGTTVAGGGPPPRGGLVVSYASPSFAARIGAASSRSRSTSRQQMFIVVRTGTEGSLMMGGDVYITRLGYWGPYGYALIAEREFVGRVLVVRPTILPGGKIAVELWPRFSTRRGRFIDVTQLATRVVVNDGQPLVIGGLNTAEDEVTNALFAVGTRAESSTSTLLLTAKIGGLDLEGPRGR